MVTVAFVPARGGSKGLPGKNLAEILGVPLVGRAVQAALGAGIDATVVSSDDDDILMAGSRYGAQPLRRPDRLATDDTRSLDVIADFVRSRPDVSTLVVLQPTSPLRRPIDIYRTIKALEQSGGASAVTVAPAGHPAEWLMLRDDGGQLTPVLGWKRVVRRRQDSPVTYQLNGAVYAVRASHIRSGGDLVGADTVGVVMPADRSVDIDDQAGLAIARASAERWASAAVSYVVMGAGGHARSVIDALVRRGKEVGAIGDVGAGRFMCGAPVLAESAALDLANSVGLSAVVAIGDNRLRLEVLQRVLDREIETPAFVAATATAAESAGIGLGTVMLEGSHVGPGTALGPAVVLNSGSIVEHDCRVGEAAHIAPGAVVGGGARVGARTLVGSGAVVNPGITVYSDVVVGSGAVVTKDVPSGATVTGVPATAAGSHR